MKKGDRYKITDEISNFVKKTFLTSKDNSYKDLIEKVKEKFDVELSQRSMLDIVSTLFSNGKVINGKANKRS